MLQGIDVSSFQSETYTTSGLDFVFVKVTEGTSYINPKQTAQAAHGRAAGCVIGFYHFLHPGNVAAQAQDFVNQADSQAGDILACDWEPTSSGLASVAEKDAFIRAVKALRPNHRVILYCDRDRWIGVDTTSYAGDGLWIADYTTAGQPRVKDPWLFHQYTDAAPQGGDGDVANFASRAALVKWATALLPTPTPAPTPTPTPASVYTEDDMPAYLTIPAGTDVDIPVEPAGTLTAPQGGAKNGPMWIGLAAQGADASVAVSFHTAKGSGAPTTIRLTHGGGKRMITLPTDGSVDVVRVHSTGAPLLAYVVGRQVA